MARLVVITDPETALGFRLAGVEVTEVRGREEAADRLLALLKRREAGVVIFNAEHLTSLSEKQRAAVEDSITPVFFALPISRLGRIGEPREVYLARLLRRAIGFQVKIKR